MADVGNAIEKERSGVEVLGIRSSCLNPTASRNSLIKLECDNLFSPASSKCSVPKLLGLIGNTPFVQVEKLLEPHQYKCQFFAKCEFRNPSGSSWDRLIATKVQEIQRTGKLNPRTHFVTGGNPNVCTSLAWAGAAGNFSVSLLPNGADTEEKRRVWKGLGANIILSYKQDPFSVDTRACLENHIKQLENTSETIHHTILPSVTEDSVQVYENVLAKEISFQYNVYTGSGSTEQPHFDLIVICGDNKSMLYGLTKRFQSFGGKTSTIIGVDISKNSFSGREMDEDYETELMKSVHWMSVTDAEAFDMARRLIREEGLMVGFASGAVMAAAVKAVKQYEIADDPATRILLILPDSFSEASSSHFLSTDWMVASGYYNPAILESLLWWYDMALENVNPPVVMTVPPEAPVNIVWKAMGRSLAERAAVIDVDENKTKTVVGVVTYNDLTTLMNSTHGEKPIKDVCYKQFGVIDSKQTLTDLEVLLRRFHWIVKMHRITVFGAPQEPPRVSDDVIGVINYGDFMRYKRKIETHHLREYGMKMSDGIPSPMWVERFNTSFAPPTPAPHLSTLIPQDQPDTQAVVDGDKKEAQIIHSTDYALD